DLYLEMIMSFVKGEKGKAIRIVHNSGDSMNGKLASFTQASNFLLTQLTSGQEQLQQLGEEKELVADRLRTMLRSSELPKHIQDIDAGMLELFRQIYDYKVGLSTSPDQFSRDKWKGDEQNPINPIAYELHEIFRKADSFSPVNDVAMTHPGLNLTRGLELLKYISRTKKINDESTEKGNGPPSSMDFDMLIRALSECFQISKTRAQHLYLSCPILPPAASPLRELHPPKQAQAA
ncbi:MAG: hypothetical protein JW774_10030, partial [Candidatus Aureabacteria bacterium]|nr:hypothetical protein [Candidatus Auribacterota bacterium]